MNIKQFTIASLTAGLLAGCASHDHVNQDELDRIQSTAVVMYSVPQTISVNSKEATEITHTQSSRLDNADMLNLAGDMLGGLAKKATDLATSNYFKKDIDGQEAANIALPYFINELNKLEGWKVTSPVDVAQSKVYQSASKNFASDDSLKMTKQTARKALAPTGFVNLGLPDGHNANVAFYDNDTFKQWAAKTARDLNVDSVIVIADTGIATDQTSLFSGGKCYVKSAFHFAMFDNNGEKIVDTRADYEKGTIQNQHGCSNGQFHKKDYMNAMQQHGLDQANAVSQKLNELKG